jgi:hypothetical protein
MQLLVIIVTNSNVIHIILMKSNELRSQYGTHGNITADEANNFNTQSERRSFTSQQKAEGFLGHCYF